ncbi:MULTISPECIES: SRPBCC family protein [Amycolatopsis]|uniref:SRPBCC family protein n=1 Tax=Amycolatopsis thermalba TaxID=944492 RepID=A0ABY4NZK7_9PSEU|nr:MULTISPECIES: SRPBCC family protein [Amycolatopsis]OXM66383.1 MxaD family protein [Amycolatopsis sp. KNN50.9b]UQS25426.1 SRPBCC family protein [Amycolatopsis thermalba]
MQSYDVTAESTAPPSAVWALLLDARSWPSWSPIDALETGQSQGLSADGRDGVGAVRAFRTGKVVTKERITELEPGRRFAYEGAENPQLSDYRAAIELQELPGGGTRIRWHGTFSARFGMRWFLQRYLRRFMQDMATGLAEHAAQR